MNGIYEITTKFGKLLVILAITFAVLHFLIKGILKLESRFMNKILNRIEYTNDFAVNYAHVNDVIYIRERIANKNVIPIPNIRVDYSTSSLLEFPESKTTLINLSRMITSFFSLETSQRITRNWKIKCTARGFYNIKAATLSVRGFFSGTAYSKGYEVNSNLWVYPEFIDMHNIFNYNSSPMGDILVKRWIMEDPFLFSGVRTYMPGDALKKIHWGLTAKKMEIMVRQNDYTSEMKLCVALNVKPSPEKYSNIIDSKIAETGIKVAATLTDKATEINAPVSFMCNVIKRGSRNKMEKINFGKGKKHFSHIMENMAQILLKNSRTLTELIEEVYSSVSDSETVIITHYVNSDALSAARRLSSRGNNVQFIILDAEDTYIDVIRGFDALYLNPDDISA